LINLWPDEARLELVLIRMNAGLEIKYVPAPRPIWVKADENLSPDR
jgi:hypothetical protein